MKIICCMHTSFHRINNVREVCNNIITPWKLQKKRKKKKPKTKIHSHVGHIFVWALLDSPIDSNFHAPMVVEENPPWSWIASILRVEVKKKVSLTEDSNLSYISHLKKKTDSYILHLLMIRVLTSKIIFQFKQKGIFYSHNFFNNYIFMKVKL